MGSMSEATSGNDLLECLRALAARLALEIDTCDDQKNLASLARQYRETVQRIDEIEGGIDGEDEIAAIIVRNRKSGAD